MTRRGGVEPRQSAPRRGYRQFDRVSAMRSALAICILAVALTAASSGARADDSQSMAAIDYLSDCIDDAISFTHLQNRHGMLELHCGSAPARRFYDWLGGYARDRQDRRSEGLFSLREFGPNACSALLEDGSGKRPDPPVFACELRLDVGGILER
jgi:hypothetical protein